MAQGGFNTTPYNPSFAQGQTQNPYLTAPGFAQGPQGHPNPSPVGQPVAQAPCQGAAFTSAASGQPAFGGALSAPPQYAPVPQPQQGPVPHPVLAHKLRAQRRVYSPDSTACGVCGGNWGCPWRPHHAAANGGHNRSRRGLCPAVVLDASGELPMVVPSG